MGRILYTLDHKTIVSKDRGLQYLSERSAEEWGFIKRSSENTAQSKRKANALKVEKSRYDEEVFTAFN